MMTLEKSNGKLLAVLPSEIISVNELDNSVWIKLRSGETYCMKGCIKDIVSSIYHSSSESGMTA